MLGNWEVFMVVGQLTIFLVTGKRLCEVLVGAAVFDTRSNRFVFSTRRLVLEVPYLPQKCISKVHLFMVFLKILLC